MESIYTIVVTYNGMQSNWIQKCLDSLLASSVKTNIIIIDNASIDGTINFIQKNYPQVDLVISNENIGFAKANNIGIKKAYEQGADYVFLLNQDAWVEENTLNRLYNVFKQIPDAGIVSSIHLNGEKTNLDKGFLNYVEHNNTPNFISDLYFNRLKDFYKTRFINAAAWLISRECIEKVGGFDTSIFFHYGEDNNYCQRVLYHKFKIYIATNATICHDREERNEKEPNENQVWQCVCYGDIQKEDKTVSNGIHLLLIKRIVLCFRTITKLQIKDFLVEIKILKKEINCYSKIRKSRMKNKQGGLVWLESNNTECKKKKK
jgi:GT2 family glycosyltransferase